MTGTKQRQRRRALTTLIMLSASTTAVGQTAFPGADGAARNVTGGRGGIVYKVTKLNAAIDDPARNDFGTLNYGLNNANFPAGPRTIVFDVGGVINLGRLPQPANNNWQPNGNGWDTQSRINIPSNVTVAGQTAPGGITITGGVVKISSSNVIFRNVTIAPGYGNRNFYQPGAAGPVVNDFPDSYVYDAIDISGQNIMIDHVSTVYATDETISANELANNLTVQYTNISQAQNYPQADAEAGVVRYTGHGLASLLQAGSNANISLHHNLFANQKGRLPRVGSEVGTGAYNDFRNNVFYNWFGTAGGGASGQPSFNNFVGNFYRAGPGGDDVSQLPGPDGVPNNLDDIGVVVNAAGGTGIFSGNNSTGTRVYQSGNLKDTNKDGDANDGVALTNSDFGSSTFAANPYWTAGGATYTGVTDTAMQAYDRVLNYMGANWWTRDGVIDTIDERLIYETRTGTGKVMAWADDPFNNSPTEGVEWRTLNSQPMTQRAANFDTDQDGMPDAWEQSLGLNPLAANNNGDFDTDGYTDLEEYLNEIAAWPAPKPLVWTGGNGRYALQSNWDINWQPSRYDTVQVNTGTATIDAVGQAAGTVQIAAGAMLRLSAGANLTQRFNAVASSGKLDVADNALIIDYATTSSLSSVAAQIASARNTGSWTGNGITSTQANLGEFALGFGEASTVLGIGGGDVGVFRGQIVDDTTVLVVFTRYGDANLDRSVNLDDFTSLAASFGSAGTWTTGDFDYNGVVNLDDFTLLASNFGTTLPAGAPRSSIPEPSALGIVIAALALATRRR